MDKHKALQAAERLLKQGKVQAALAELQRVSKSAPNDLLTLNRLADLLARQGRHAEAIDHYNRIASRFQQGGFFPKAIAIHKKTLRLDPHNVESLVQLGELYLLQRLTGEARTHFLLAAEQFLKAQKFDGAREVYEKLVRAEPKEPRHRVRLAEARAAEGDLAAAGKDLLDLASSLLAAGNPAEAERIYRRCLELLPAASEPKAGLARALWEQDLHAEAIELLRKAAAGAVAPSPEILGQLALCYELADRSDEAQAVLTQISLLEFPTEPLLEIFKVYLGRGQADQIWQRMERPLEEALARGGFPPVVALLERLAEIEEHGHIQALQRLYELEKKAEDRQGMTRTLEWLVRAYQARSMHDEASLMLDRLREELPGSPTLPQVLSRFGDAAALQASEQGSADASSAGDPGAPAVPLSRSEQDYVAGRLTQAEILEKYDLQQQALAQLREATRRFPGHVEAQQRLVVMLRARGDKIDLAQALVHLGLAQRAAGDLAAAKQSVEEAASLGPFAPAERRTLEQLELIEGPPPAFVTGSEVSADIDEADAPPAAGASPAPTGDEIVIDFDAGAATAGAPTPAARSVRRPQRARPTRAPTQDMLDEIQAHFDGARLDEADRGIKNLRALGYASAELDALEGAVAGRTPARPAAAREKERPPTTPVPPATLSAEDDDEDLSAITAALEDELFTEERQPALRQETAEESLDDIFASFKHHVREQVAVGDHRTHYDLGIAYKEMGLIEEAIQEFEMVIGSDTLHREACNMMAICHRDLNDMPQAARWFREALAAPGDDSEAQRALRYDLADVLLQSGDAEGALGLFRDVMEGDPSFRDVQTRVSEIESRLGS